MFTALPTYRMVQYCTSWGFFCALKACKKKKNCLYAFPFSMNLTCFNTSFVFRREYGRCCMYVAGSESIRRLLSVNIATNRAYQKGRTDPFLVQGIGCQILLVNTSLPRGKKPIDSRAGRTRRRKEVAEASRSIRLPSWSVNPWWCARSSFFIQRAFPRVARPP